MCGIAGFIFGESLSADPPDQLLERMISALSHRGPDESGKWIDQTVGVALGHRRLSIVDLSPAGHQPMISSCGQMILIFNGEIYNHQALRTALETDARQAWRGHSDTETLLACFSAWGVEHTLQAIVGMFALALWNRNTRTLVLARDRFGEKPLYFGFHGNSLIFASELKALRAIPSFSGQIDRDALDSFMQHGYVPEGQCIYRGLTKLSPGSWITLSIGDLKACRVPMQHRYWSSTKTAILGCRRPLEFRSDRSAVDALERVLGEAVRGQLMSDVPLGAFLSGGVDSSAVVALMQSCTSKPVRTFTIGFAEVGYDESGYAEAVARHLGTNHTQLIVTSDDALAVIPRLPMIYDEPFADPSQVPTYLVAAMACSHVTVALSGDGGDELFGGYNRYLTAARLWHRFQTIPVVARRLAALGIHALSPSSWDLVAAAIKSLTPANLRMRVPGDKLHKAADVLASRDGRELYNRLTSHWFPGEVVLGAVKSLPDTLEPWLDLPDLVQQMMLSDTSTYLPGDILTKIDRATMAVSLETRVPMLDHRVYEFAWRLPMKYKVRDGVGKWVLRELLSRYVPKALFERPKMGFAMPIAAWLRGPLRDWAETLLEEGRLKNEGHLDPKLVRRIWRQHLSGQRNWQLHLWDVLMFQSWLENHNAG